MAYLLTQLKEKGLKGAGCLIGAPADMRVVTSNKGFCEWHVEMQGKVIHSAMALMSTSCNAIEYAAQIIAEMCETALDITKSTAQERNYSCSLACISTDAVVGGSAVNTVPAECDVVCSVRRPLGHL
uniref:Acetylornithine deacetylase-like protein n=1 Tax=Leishmania major TaxID=5664 RepID=A0A0R6Y076_LEIMA|nr:acetylornithine deacetylase-like protein [Leishmania major]